MINDAPICWRWLGRVAGLAIAAGAVAAVVAGGVAVAVSQTLPKQYDSQAGVIVGSLTATSTDELAAYQTLAVTYAQLATSTPLLTRVIDKLGLAEDPVDLETRITVRASGQGIVLIDAIAGTPAEAAQIANEVADEIVTMALPTSTASPSPSASPTPARTASSSFGASPSPAGSAAASLAPSISPTPPSGSSLATIFQPALPPADPSSPRVLLNMVIAGLLGFVLGAGFAVFLATRRLPVDNPAG